MNSESDVDECQVFLLKEGTPLCTKILVALPKYGPRQEVSLLVYTDNSSTPLDVKLI